MENLELKEELAVGSSMSDTDFGGNEKVSKKDLELNVKAAPFEPNFTKFGNSEIVVSPFQRSLNTTSASDGSPKSPELDDHQSTINNLVKQLNSAKSEID